MWKAAALVCGIGVLGSASAFASQAEPPGYLSPAGRAAFETYLASPVSKAFAAEPTGGYAWTAGRETSEAARQEALDSCRRANPDKQCIIISVDGLMPK